MWTRKRRDGIKVRSTLIVHRPQLKLIVHEHHALTRKKSVTLHEDVASTSDLGILNQAFLIGCCKFILFLRDFVFFCKMVKLRMVELLTPHNYHSWKLKMQQLLQSKGLWQTLGENQPTFTKEMEKFAYRNKLDEAMGLIGLHVSDSYSTLMVVIHWRKVGISWLPYSAKSTSSRLYNWKRNCLHWSLMSMAQLRTILPSSSLSSHNWRDAKRPSQMASASLWYCPS